jgi:cobalt/nickel transport protein
MWFFLLGVAMKRLMSFYSAWIVLFFFVLVLSQHVFAHFGMVIPSNSMIMQENNRNIRIFLSFSHPFEMKGMELEKPKRFDVIFDGEKSDLLETLKKTQVMEHIAWETDFPVKRPGVYIFSMEPVPYWEPAEDCFIIHYTKTVITAFGDDEGWDAEADLKTEIVPISKPFGLYAGNVFQGVVKLDGKTVPFAEVEIEYFNQDKTAEAPTEYMITQTIKADQNGIFTYAVPAAGWWGFSALNTADFTLKHDGEDKDVELGAVIWVQFHDWKSN